MENVTWTHQVDLFSNYLDSPGNIDINWTGLLELEVNESLRTTISTHLIYDDDVVLEKEPARTETNDQGVVVAIPARLGPGAASSRRCSPWASPIRSDQRHIRRAAYFRRHESHGFPRTGGAIPRNGAGSSRGPRLCP